MKPFKMKSNFDRKTGISSVTINTPYGQFTGIAKLHPEDINHASEFAGCEIAEMRANIKYLKEQRKEAKIQYKAIQCYYNAISETAEFNPYSKDAQIARRMIKEYTAEIVSLSKTIEAIQSAIKRKIKTRDEVLTKLDRWAKISK